MRSFIRPALGSARRQVAAGGPEETAARKTQWRGEAVIPFFRWRVYGAREPSQGSVLRSDERALAGATSTILGEPAANHGESEANGGCQTELSVIEVESRTLEVVLSRDGKIFNDRESGNCIKQDERVHLGLGRTAYPRFLLPFRRE